MKLTDPAAAVAAIADGSTLVLGAGCSHPVRFYDAFAREVERFRRLTVCSALALGGYPHLEKGLGDHFRYVTWHASPALRHLFRDPDPRKVGFVPARLGELPAIVRRGGPISPDVAVVQTSLPLDDGTVSLGISVGPNRHYVEQAPLVIAEMNAHMPVTCGASRIPLEAIDLAFESDAPLAVYDTGEPDARDARIIEHVLSLVPERAWVQCGIGAVPDRVLARLADIAGVNLFSGLLSQSLVHYLDGVRHDAEIVNGELAGDQALYDRCHLEARLSMQPVTVTHDPARLAGLERFVSINSAIEIDLQGQSNGETLGATQISGAGGSQDYVDAATRSPGGVSIIAMPATTADGRRSKIVPALPAGSAVTTPRYSVDCVITEYGIARLRGRTLHERAEALIAIAHPDFRDGLADGL